MPPAKKSNLAPGTVASLRALYEQRAAKSEPGGPQDWRRDHLGASVIGHKCDRYLWNTFRWVGEKLPDGRMLRLLERGNREESWILDDLHAMGMQVHDRDATGEQWRVKWGHVGGGVDAVLVGVLEAPDVPHLGEVKSANKKQFARLVERGVKSAKPEHYVQMQVYMHGLELSWALYIAVCKDDDGVHAERVPYDRAVAEEAVKRAQRISVEHVPPPRQESPDFPPCMLTSQDGTQWPCKFHGQCWKGGIPERSCRTCISSTPLADGTWRCDKHERLLSPLGQRNACEDHLSLPSIVLHQVQSVSAEGHRITYQTAEGETIVDGFQQ